MLMKNEYFNMKRRERIKETRFSILSCFQAIEILHNEISTPRISKTYKNIVVIPCCCCWKSKIWKSEKRKEIKSKNNPRKKKKNDLLFFTFPSGSPNSIVGHLTTEINLTSSRILIY